VIVILSVIFVDTVIASYAKSVGAAHFDTSAKSNKGLDEVFIDLSTSKCPLVY